MNVLTQNNPKTAPAYSISNPFVALANGQTIDLLDPKPNQIHFPSIIDGLAKIARFNGQTHGFYSVAQHSCLVADLLPKDPTTQLYGLLHDAHEAVLGDIITPVKHALLVLGNDNEAQCLTILSLRLDEAIHEAAGLAPTPPAETQKLIKEADLIALKIEARDLMDPCHRDWGLSEIPTPPDIKIKALPWQYASAEFQNRFKKYAQKEDE